MQIDFNGNEKDLSMMLVSAERYALGRRTYIVCWTCEVIKNNLELFSENDIEVMIRDIESAWNLGEECDKKEWLELLKILKDRRQEKWIKYGTMVKRCFGGRNGIYNMPVSSRNIYYL